MYIMFVVIVPVLYLIMRCFIGFLSLQPSRKGLGSARPAKLSEALDANPHRLVSPGRGHPHLTHLKHGLWIWVCLKMSCTPLYPMVLLIIIPMKNGYFIGKINPTFSDKPICDYCILLWLVAQPFSSRLTSSNRSKRAMRWSNSSNSGSWTESTSDEEIHSTSKNWDPGRPLENFIMHSQASGSSNQPFQLIFQSIFQWISVKFQMSGSPRYP